MTTKNIWTMLLCAAVLTVSSCKKDDDLPEVPQPVVNEPEQITTVLLHFTETTTMDHFEVKWSDADGPGGDAPVIEDINLKAGSTYEVEMDFLDESDGESEDITTEIQEEDDEHLVCFETSSELGADLVITRTDSDGTYGVGLESSWVTTMASSGEVTISLKHQPDGIKDGSCTPGDTDVEVTYNLIIAE